MVRLNKPSYWVEEHFWTEESLVTHIELDQVVVKCFVHESFELVRLYYSTSVIYFLFVELRVFF